MSDDVATFLDAVKHRPDQTRELVALLRDVTGEEPTLWNSSILGFGSGSYTTADGKEHPWFTVGIASRSAALTLYGLLGDDTADLLRRLGPHSTGKGCLYLKRLDAIDRDVLRQIIATAAARQP